MTRSQMLEAAVAGDEQAYADLVEPHRTALRAHCYRMLGSIHDAEDAVQEALLRAWRSLSSFHGRSSMRSWLYTIATNVCLRAIERRPQRVLPVDYGPPGDPHQPRGEPFVESTWIEPYGEDELRLDQGFAGPEARYEQRESVELAFIAALQHLPARQRAVLLLRDVLGFSGAEVATALQTTPASVYSALQRAHETVDHRLPERSQQATLDSLGDERLQGIVGRYVEAWERHDIDTIVAMLTEDVTIAMPPTATWYRGRDAVAAFLRARPLAGGLRWQLNATRSNGQLAAGAHLWDPATGSFRAHHTAVLTLRGEMIEQINTFLEPWALTVPHHENVRDRVVTGPPRYERERLGADDLILVQLAEPALPGGCGLLECTVIEPIGAGDMYRCRVVATGREINARSSSIVALTAKASKHVPHRVWPDATGTERERAAHRAWVENGAREIFETLEREGEFWAGGYLDGDIRRELDELLHDAGFAYEFASNGCESFGIRRPPTSPATSRKGGR